MFSCCLVWFMWTSLFFVLTSGINFFYALSKKCNQEMPYNILRINFRLSCIVGASCLHVIWSEINAGFFYSNTEQRGRMVAAKRRLVDECVKQIELKNKVICFVSRVEFFHMVLYYWVKFYHVILACGFMMGMTKTFLWSIIRASIPVSCKDQGGYWGGRDVAGERRARSSKEAAREKLGDGEVEPGLIHGGPCG